MTRYAFVAVFFCMLMLPHSANAASTGAKLPTLGTTASEAPWSDNDWTTPTNIYSDNGSTANVTAATFDSPDQTFVLKATGFDFSAIPDNATIDGVIVIVETYYRSGQGSGSLDLCQLLDVSRAKVGTNNCSTPVALSSVVDATITRGTATSTWGNALTPEWVKDPDFGIALGILATAANADVDVDWVTIEVFYTVPDFTLSGTLYSDESITPIAASKTVRAAVGTSTVSVHSTTTNASGAWTMNLGGNTSITPSTPITIWVDGDTSTRAALFTKASSSAFSISGLNLAQNRVIVSHEGTSGTSTVISNMSFYDGDDDPDIQYRANGGELTVHQNQELHIMTGKTFAPGGPVTINGNASTTSMTDGSLHLSTASTYTAGGTTTIAGNFTASSTATFNTYASGTVFTSTTTGRTVDIPLTTSLGDVTFSGPGGMWTWVSAATTSNFSIGANATVTAPSSTLTITGDYSNYGAFTSNNGTTSIYTTIMEYISGRDTSGSATGTDSASGLGIAFSGNYAYVGKLGNATACGQTAGSAIGCELAVFDISSTSLPIYVAGRDASGSSNGTGNLNMHYVVVSGNFLYTGKAASATACSQTAGSAIGCELMVWDISSSTNPVYVAGRDVTGDSTGVGSLTIFSLAIRGNHLYVGRDPSATACSQTAGSAIGCELMVFDISSSTNPAYVAGRDSTGSANGVGATWINSMAVAGDYLYVTKGGNSTACSQTPGTSPGCELMVFDISSTSNPIYAAGRDSSGNAGGTGATTIRGIAVSGHYLYLGKDGVSTGCSQTAGSAEGCEFMIFDVSSSTNPVYVVGRDSTGNSSGTGVAAVRTISVSGNYAYLGKLNDATACSQTAGSAEGCEFMVYDLSSTTNPTYYAGRDTSGSTNGTASVLTNFVVTKGNYVYVARGSNATACSQTAGSAEGCEFSIFKIGSLLRGNMTGSSAWNHLSAANGRIEFENSASTTNLINSGSLVAPGHLSIAGNYTNTGSLVAGNGTTTLSGTSQQTLSGNMTASSSFSNLEITNTWGAGSSSQSIIFANSASTTDTFTMQASTSARFLANATSSFQDVALKGATGQYVWLRSSSPGTRYGFYVPGTQKQVTYVDVQDSSACPSSMLASNSVNSGNNNCWSFLTPILLSGSMYNDEGVTLITSSKLLGIAIGTTTTSVHATTTGTGGTWSFLLSDGGSISPSTPVLVWFDGDTSTRGALFTKASSMNDITGLNLYQNRVIVSHEGVSGTSTTIANMSFYDGDNDPDIQYTANNGELSVRANQKLYVKENKTFAPGGPVSVHGNASSTSATDGSFLISSGATYTAGGTTTIAGNFNASSTATFAPNASGTVFTATTTGKTIVAPLSSIGPVIFNGSGGTWNFATSATTSRFTILNGTTTAPSSQLVIQGDYVNSGIFSHNSGTVIISGSTSTLSGTMTGSSSFSSLSFASSTSSASSTGWVIASGIIDIPITETETIITDPMNATSSDNRDAQANAGGSAAKGYYYFNPTIAGAVRGIELQMEAMWNAAPSGCNVIASLSFDGGRTFTGTKTFGAFNTASDVTNIVGGSNDAWGRKWYPHEFLGINFVVHLDLTCGISNTLDIDMLQAKVYFQSPTSTMLSNASTTNLTIDGTLTAPAYLSISGNYTNNGTFIAGSGTTTLNGTSQQPLSGNMTASSSFNNLEITNTWGAGSSSQSILFQNPASTTDTFYMRASTSARFLANATSTFQHIYLDGAAGQYVWLRSSSPGNRYGFYVPATQKLVRYVDAQDSSACPTTMNASDGTSVNSGNNACWDFPGASATISSAANQSFTYNQSATAVQTITVTDAISPIITAGNDLRIKIATSTVRMLFDTTDTSASFGGSASSKVSNPVSFEGGGSVLVIPVDTNFEANDTLTVEGLSFTSFTATNSPVIALSVYVDGPADVTAEDTDDKTVGISGSLTLSNHSSGQVSNAFTGPNISSALLYGLRLVPSQENISVTSLILQLQGIKGLGVSDITNAALYRDLNGDRVFDGGDVAVGGSGAVSISGKTGTITWSSVFTATTSQSYIMVADVENINPKDSLICSLPLSGITATGVLTGVSVTETGSTDNVQHARSGGRGGGGQGSAIGGDAPQGDGTQTGGGAGGGGAAGGNPPPGDGTQGGGGAGGGGAI